MDARILSTLAAVRESLPCALVDDKAYSRLASVAAALPADLTTFWGFEIRLGEPEPAADILFQTRSSSMGQRVLAGLEPSAVDGLADRHAAWRSLRGFAGLWSDPGHTFHDAIRNIWLEFDSAGAAPSRGPDAVLATPSIFFGPDYSVGRERFSTLVPEVLSALGEGSWRAQELWPFAHLLPDGARVFQVGLMLSRSDQGLRVCVNELPPDRIPGWLSAMGWPGDVGALVSLLETIAPMLKLVAVALSLSRGEAEPRPDAKIGLECYKEWSANDAEEWAPFLGYLEERSLCLPEKRKGLLEYPGVTRLPSRGFDIARGLMRLDAYRKIHHIKLDVVGSGVVRAKAYLAVSHPIVHIRRALGIGTEAPRGNGPSPDGDRIVE